MNGERRTVLRYSGHFPVAAPAQSELALEGLFEQVVAAGDRGGRLAWDNVTGGRRLLKPPVHFDSSNLGAESKSEGLSVEGGLR